MEIYNNGIIWDHTQAVSPYLGCSFTLLACLSARVLIWYLQYPFLWGYHAVIPWYFHRSFKTLKKAGIELAWTWEMTLGPLRWWCCFKTQLKKVVPWFWMNYHELSWLHPDVTGMMIGTRNRPQKALWNCAMFRFMALGFPPPIYSNHHEESLYTIVVH